MLRRLIHFCYTIVLSCMLYNCVEPFDATTGDFESALVIDALITDEMKHQEINLSRAFRLEEETAGAESNATVRVVDGMQNEYVFEEIGPGQYVSVNMFAAQPNITYQLSVTTSEGSVYESDQVVLPKKTPMDDLYAAAETNDQNVEGVAILVDTFDPDGESQYYRFDYEETFKIIPPFWNPMEFVIISEDPVFIVPQPRTQEERVCFKTVRSVSLILGDTSGFSEDRLTRFPVRFLARDDYIIAHRYSILVKQYVISREAYVFYETLNEFSGLESIFSENQPGFFNGNITPQSNPREKVVGFFDVSSVDERRIFFNHEDFFPEDLIPAFAVDCPITTPVDSDFITGVRFRRIEFWAQHTPEDATEGDYKVVPMICGDCTVLGSNIVPDFWVE